MPYLLFLLKFPTVPERRTTTNMDMAPELGICV
jgi:hypothetical protein